MAIALKRNVTDAVATFVVTLEGTTAQKSSQVISHCQSRTETVTRLLNKETFTLPSCSAQRRILMVKSTPTIRVRTRTSQKEAKELEKKRKETRAMAR